MLLQPSSGIPFRWLLCPFDTLPSFVCVFFKLFSTSVSTRCSRIIISIFCPSFRISYFSTEPWFLFLEMMLETNIWVLDVLTATGMRVLLGPVSWHSPVYIHITVNISAGNICICYAEFILTSPTLIHQQVDNSALLLWFTSDFPLQ